MKANLPNGKVLAHGVILGAWPAFRGTTGNNKARLLSDVALKLREQYTLAVTLPENQGDMTGYLRNGMRSEVLTSGRQGTVVRANQGAGVVIVGSTTYELDGGDWAYIPHDRRYQFEGRMITGMSFQVAYADLLRS